jgi:hypothetical protein
MRCRTCESLLTYCTGTVNLVCVYYTKVFPVVLSPVTMYKSVPTPVGCVVVEGIHLRKERPLKSLILTVSRASVDQGTSLITLPLLPPSLLFLFFFESFGAPLGLQPTNRPTVCLFSHFYLKFKLYVCVW